MNLRVKLASIWRLSALRQAVILSLVFLLLLTLAGIFSLVQFDRVFEDRIEAELRDRHATISADIATRGFVAEAYPWSRTERVFVLGPDDRLRDGYHEYLNVSRTMRIRSSGDSNGWYYLARDVDGGQLVVGTNEGRRDEFIEVILQSMGIVGLSAGAIALSFGLFLGLRTQARVNAISNTLKAAATGDLLARVGETRQRDDLDDLAHQVDDTITQLDALIRQTRDFSVNIAHDLKTPLARLRLRLENALTAEVDHGDSAEDIGLALEQTDDVIAIFDAFMRVAKLEAGTTKANFESIDLGALIHQVAEIYEAVVEDSGRRLICDVDGPATVQADRVLLTQMLANLIENAMRYTPEGTSLTLIAHDKVLGLADTGPGIPAEEYDRITQPLYRLDKSRNQDGAGLGLALVKTIANVHQAELSFSNNPALPMGGLLVQVAFRKNGYLTAL